MKITTASGIAGMLRGFSIEISPRHSETVAMAEDCLDPGTEVFLTWIPGADPMQLVKPAAMLQRVGLFPVPHIGARHLETSAQLERLAARLVDEAGVDRLLIVGGDRAKPAGPYDSSLAVLQTGVFQKMGITRIAVAGFPEGNPNISAAVLEKALEAKLKLAAREGLQLSIVTQFCFQADPIIAWLRCLRARGIDVPVRIGLAGPAGLVTLARYAMRCGVGNSLHVLREHPSFARLLTERGPEPIIRGIVESSEQDETAGLPFRIAGLHFFVFGGFNRTMNWINAERAQS